MRSQRILAEVASKHHMEVSDILSRDRSLMVVKARKEAICRMKSVGLSTALIAGALELDTSTVLYHANPKAQKRKQAYRISRLHLVRKDQPNPEPESRFVDIRADLWAPLIRYCIHERVTVETAVAQFVRDGIEGA